MGTTLTGNKIKDTYKSLIKVSDSTEASSSAKQLSDGDGNDLGLYIDTDGVFGIGAPASFTLDISSATDGVALPVGTTANRPTGSAGIIRYNSTLGKLEYYDTAFKQIASESYVSAAIDNLIDSAPGTLDTLNEIAAALNDDPDFHTTITTLINGKEDTITGAATTITSSDLTTDRAVISGTGGKIEVSVVTSTELGYLSGVTGGIQSQIDSKQDTLTAGNGIDISGTTISTDLTNLVDTGAIQNDAVTAIKLDQFDDNLTAATAGDILISNGTDFDNVTVTGDVTINSSGVTTIGLDTIDGSNIADDSIDSEHYADGSIDLQHLSTDSVNGDKIADDSINTDHLVDDSVTADKLANTTVTAGTYGDANNTPQITVDAQGRLTSVTNVATAGSGGGGAGTLDIEQDTFNGDGSTVAFTLTSTAYSKNNLQVFIDGVYQSKDNFSVSGSTLTFTTAPSTGTDNIEVIHLKSVIGSVKLDSFTGDSSDTTFDLANTIAGENNTQVFIDGVYQSKSNYSTSGTTITFSTAPPNGSAIEVVHIVPDSAGGGGIDWDSTVQTGNFTATAGAGYFVDTTSAAITVTLPSSPTAGDEVSIVDYAGTADTNNIKITSSDNINGSSNDAIIDYERGGISLVYVDATQGWIAYNAVNETNQALNQLPPLEVDYLVVAGGGSGGTSGGRGGGGGAGGYRTSYNDGTVSALSLSTLTNYTVTVGAGGSAVATNETDGNNGQNSTFASITATGGGGGGGFSRNGKSGGSGGGGSWSSSAVGGTGNAGSYTPVEGYNGGTGGSSLYGAGGGGGASEIGADGSGNDGGNGGNGLSNTILNSTNAATASVGEVSGSNIYYAGGGGGGGTGVGGTGGIGGASDGTSGDASANATANTGGGSGGAGASATGSGGSGVVILRYPSGYTITVGAGITEASGSPFTEGSDKISVFTGGTGNISFS
jgi:hypothetical protein